VVRRQRRGHVDGFHCGGQRNRRRERRWDLIVLADTTQNDPSSIEVAVRRGTGVTQAAFEGVYSVSQYGGTTITAMFGKRHAVCVRQRNL